MELIAARDPGAKTRLGRGSLLPTWRWPPPLPNVRGASWKRDFRPRRLGLPLLPESAGWLSADPDRAGDEWLD